METFVFTLRLQQLRCSALVLRLQTHGPKKRTAAEGVLSLRQLDSRETEHWLELRPPSKSSVSRRRWALLFCVQSMRTKCRRRLIKPAVRFLGREGDTLEPSRVSFPGRPDGPTVAAKSNLGKAKRRRNSLWGGWGWRGVINLKANKNLSKCKVGRKKWVRRLKTHLNRSICRLINGKCLAVISVWALTGAAGESSAGSRGHQGRF